jgi:hypothetical protein
VKPMQIIRILLKRLHLSKNVVMDEMTKSSLQSGLMLGIILILLSVLSYMSGLGSSFWFLTINSLIVLVILIIGMYRGIRNVRDKILGGSLKFGHGVLISFLIGFTAVLVSSIYSLLFNAYIDPDYSLSILEGMITRMEQMPGMPAAQIEEMYKQYDEVKNMSAFQLMWQGMRTSLVFMLALSVILALILKKNPSPFTEGE